MLFEGDCFTRLGDCNLRRDFVRCMIMVAITFGLQVADGRSLIAVTTVS